MSESPSAPSANPARALDELLDRVASALSGTGGGGDVGAGTDAGGFVQAEVTAEGRVAALEVDPRILRDSDRLAPAIVEAVNAALAARPAGTNRAATLEQLKAVQEDSLTVTKDLNASLRASLEALKGK